MNKPHIFLGGNDLEMQNIRQMLAPLSSSLTIYDKQLSWGAKASAYKTELHTILANKTLALLVELDLDIEGIENAPNIAIADHHGPRAGKDQPSALRQVWRWLSDQGHSIPWTRWHDVVSINDISHIDGLIAFGASDREIATVRRKDRQEQGITQATERQSRVDLANGKQLGEIYLVHTDLETSSAIADFAHPFYDGPSPHNLLVLSATTLSLYGSGNKIDRLKHWPNCWYGGALPQKGYWGAPITSSDNLEKILHLLQLAQHG